MRTSSPQDGLETLDIHRDRNHRNALFFFVGANPTSFCGLEQGPAIWFGDSQGVIEGAHNQPFIPLEPLGFELRKRLQEPFGVVPHAVHNSPNSVVRVKYSDRSLTSA